MSRKAPELAQRGKVWQKRTKNNHMPWSRGGEGKRIASGRWQRDGGKKSESRSFFLLGAVRF